MNSSPSLDSSNSSKAEPKTIVVSAGSKLEQDTNEGALIASDTVTETLQRTTEWTNTKNNGSKPSFNLNPVKGETSASLNNNGSATSIEDESDCGLVVSGKF